VRGGEKGREESLQAAGGDQFPSALGGTTEGGGEGVAGHAHGEGALTAPEIGDASAEQQQGAEDERIEGDDPGTVSVASARPRTPEPSTRGGTR
jgi:hypothetical protein